MSREAEALYKDKIEVSLDGRQIFYLFFGGAVIVGLVFVLGVMVGRRVEARGHVDRARTTAAADPLAALDRLEGNNGLTFKGSLMGKETPSDIERAIAAKAEAKQDAPKPEAKPEVKPEPPKPAVVEPPKPEPKKEEAKKEPPKPEVKKEEPKLEAKKEEAKKEEAKKEEKKEDKKDDKKLEVKVEPKKSETPKEDKKPEPVEEDKKPKYVLQLSSFQDKAEAEAFLSSIKASGYQAYVTEATVSGKGTFYRVRMGTYKSLEAANDAKAEFEKSSKKTASVMRL